MNSQNACFVGRQKGEYCSHSSDGTSQLKVVDISECTADITNHMRTYTNDEASLEEIKSCPKFTELHLIMNRAAIAQPMTEKVCVNHKAELGIKYRNTVNSCKFPEHSKRTSKQRKIDPKSLRPIPLDVLHEMKAVSDSSACVGSVWCSMCRIKKYSIWRSANIERISMIQTECTLCGEAHQMDDDILPGIDMISSLDSDSDIEESSQDEYDPYTPKDSLNLSLGSLSDDWTPLKAQLKKSFPLLQKSRKMDILRKSKQAIDAVLERIAPGQGHLVFEELTKSSHSSELDSVAIDGLKEAVQNANGK